MATQRRSFPLLRTSVSFGLLVVLGLGWWLWPSIQGGWARSLHPGQLVSTWLGRLTTRPSTAALQIDRDRWRQQADALSHQLTAAQEQLRVSRSLDQLQAYLQSTHRRVVSAPILTFAPDAGVQSIVIGRGSADGLRSGMAVATPSGTVIGKIRNLQAHVATVLLIFDGESAMAARIDNDQRSPGVVVGERGLSLRLRYIPTSANISVGQVVVTSGTEPNVPGGLVIGPISSLSRRAGDVFQTAVITSTVDLSSLSVLNVITG